MKQLIKFGLMLAMICFIASTVLALTYKITKGAIEAQGKKEEELALSKILPIADSFVKKEIDGIEYYEGYKGRRFLGYCVKAMGTGYGGNFHILIGIDSYGTIMGLEVLDHLETAGLGSKITEVRPGEDEPWFLRQFKGRQAASISLKGVDAITGATISSKAVVDTINRSITEFFRKIEGSG